MPGVKPGIDTMPRKLLAGWLFFFFLGFFNRSCSSVDGRLRGGGGGNSGIGRGAGGGASSVGCSGSGVASSGAVAGGIGGCGSGVGYGSSCIRRWRGRRFLRLWSRLCWWLSGIAALVTASGQQCERRRQCCEFDDFHE